MNKWHFLTFFLLIPGMAFGHGDLDEQIKTITVEINQDPKNADLYFKRGEYYRLHQEWKNSYGDYKKAKRLDRNRVDVHLGLGQLFFEKGEPKKGIKHLNRFLKKEPNRIDAIITRARSWMALKKYKKAIRDYSQVISLAKQPSPSIYIERAQATLNQKKPNLDEAAEGLQQGIQALGPLITLMTLALEIDIRKQDFESALNHIDVISAQFQRKEIWLAKRGEVLVLANKLEEAAVTYQAALYAIDHLPPHVKNNKNMKVLKNDILAKLDLTQQRKDP